MLISAIIGLLDDETGMLYYINAEHPQMILFRDGKAAFLHDQVILPKIGLTIFAEKFRVKTFKMEPKDIIITGSDGRDDLIIDEIDEHNRTINEDETLVLRALEKCNADISALETELLSFGKLSDDLSLIKVTYRPGKMPGKQNDLSEIHALIAAQKIKEAIKALQDKVSLDGDINATRLLARLYYRTKDYRRAAELYIANAIDSENTEKTLFQASLAMKKVGDLKGAIDFGERCQLREPDYLRNLINLADCYRLMKNYRRSSEIIESALELDNEDPSLLKLKSLVDAKIN